LFALIAFAVMFVAPASTPAYAATPATVSITGEHVRIGGTVTVTVSDADVRTVATYTGETVGKLTYTLPIGSTGDSFIFQTANPLLADRTDDGVVSKADLTISSAAAVPTSVVQFNGVFTVQLVSDVTTPTPFTVTYSSEKIDSLTVKVSSTSDTTGFDLKILETAADTGVFSGTFETGSATVTTNATVPTATARPDIKVVDKNIVTVTYTDTEPLSLLSDTILVDGLVPTITVLSPAHNAFEQIFSSFLEVRVTDVDSGVDFSSIKFHFDNDGNNTFTEPGTILLPDPTMTTTEQFRVIARVRVPSVAADGLRTWYVTASDLAGGVGRSDAVSGTAGNQVHIFTSDQNPPQVSSAIAGEWYDTVSKTIKTGNRTSIHVVFSEKISVPSIIAGGFRLNGAPAISAKTYAALPNDVFLTVESFPIDVPVILLIDSGAVTDLSGIETSLVPITVTDNIAPDLTIGFDRAATNSLIKISVSSDELLTATPSITINGLTRGTPVEVDTRTWELVFNIVAFTGLDVGQGVKTVGASGFDTSNTLGAATPVTFQVDTTSPIPVLSPTGAEPVSESFPDITVSYASETGEYVGDTHTGVSLILATLDGERVAPLMTTLDSGATWTLEAIDAKPDGFELGVHVFEITAVDTAGNAHPVARTVFEVDVDPALYVPEPDPVVPDPVVEEETVVDESTAAVDEGSGSDPVVEETTTTEPDGDGVEEDLSAAAEDEGVPQVKPVVETVYDPDPVVTSEDVAPVESGETSDTTDSASAPVDESVEVLDGEPDQSADAVESAPNKVYSVFDRKVEQVLPEGNESSQHSDSGGPGDTASSTAEGGAIFGCNLPLGNTNVVGGEYALLGVGLLGLGLRKPVVALRVERLKRLNQWEHRERGAIWRGEASGASRARSQSRACHRLSSRGT